MPIYDEISKMDEEIAKMYDGIATNISTDEGQCVLVLGPELSVNRKGIYYKSFFKALAEKEKEKINQYYEKENVFSFNGISGAEELFGDISSFYKDMGDDTLLELIARIKFPLIINVCPDKSINRVYKRNYVPFIYGYFCRGPVPEDEGEATQYGYEPDKNNPEKKNITTNSLPDFPKPNKNMPVVYNIFGDCDVDQSMIYNHHTFYEAMEALMSARSIPGQIAKFINKANCIIFLGFDFDSWHYQLMLHKMGLGKTSKKKSYGSLQGEGMKAKVKVVIRDYFKVSFVGENPVNTIQTIIDKLEANDDYSISLRNKAPNQYYSVYVSYSWKDKQADIVELLRKMLKTNEIEKKDKQVLAEKMITNSGKLFPVDEDLEWLFSSNKNEKGQDLEEWYHSLPPTQSPANGQKQLLYDREYVVDLLEKKLSDKGVKVFRDKKEINYGDSIDSFMSRIGTGKAVIRVVSDKYLKSRYCMDEALRISKYPGRENKIFTVVLKDDIDLEFSKKNGAPKLAAVAEDIQYKKYWQNIIEDLFGKLDSDISGIVDREREKRNYGIYIDIYDYILKFIREIKDEVHVEATAGFFFEQSRKVEEQEEMLDSFVNIIEQKLKI